MDMPLLSLRGWLVFVGTEAILAGVLWMIGLLNPVFLIVFGFILLVFVWVWDNRPHYFPAWMKFRRSEIANIQKRDWNLAQAFQYWAENTDRSDTFHTDIENAAFDENIRIWGVRDFREDAIYELIPAIHWSKSTIEGDPAIYSGSDDPKEALILERSRTHPRQKNGDVTRYWKLMVSSDEFKERWPPRSTQKDEEKRKSPVLIVGLVLVGGIVLLGVFFRLNYGGGTCTPKWERLKGVVESVDPQTLKPSATLTYRITRRTEQPYKMTLFGGEGGLLNLNVGWVGGTESDIIKFEPPTGGIKLSLNNPVGDVRVMVTPRSMAETKLEIDFECLESGTR